jgi:hypothetical protein
MVYLTLALESMEDLSSDRQARNLTKDTCRHADHPSQSSGREEKR